MKRTIILMALLIIGTTLNAKEKKHWVYSDAVLEKVFKIEATSKSTELLRLYDDGSYEHLRFVQKGSQHEEVLRNLGVFTVKKGRIIFQIPDQKEFSGKFKYGTFLYNGKLYSSLADMLIRKENELYKITRETQFTKPFFIAINSDEVVFNKESAEELDLKRLIDFLLIGKTSEKQKSQAITEFVVKSIEYDHEGLKSSRYANDQSDIKSIIAGRKRVAVCEGYANVFESLCLISGLKVETVKGYTKDGFADLLNLGGYHAWNIIEYEGEKHLFDVTWSDQGSTIDQRWIDVDPKVMIGSHFPDHDSQQLLYRPISEEQFLNSPVVLPAGQGAFNVPIALEARQFALKQFKIAVPGKHIIKASVAPSSLFDRVYYGEPGSNTTTFKMKQVGTGHFDGDSTYFIVPLAEVINPISIEIDGLLELKTVVINGTQIDLMNHYLSRADAHFADAYVKGVIAAIRLSDAEALKKLVGVEHTQFFDKKGKLNIDKEITRACLDWAGDLTSLTVTKHTKWIPNEVGIDEAIIEETRQISVPGKLTFELAKKEDKYQLLSIQK